MNTWNPRYFFNTNNAFMLSFVSQHGRSCYIANGINSRNIGVTIPINDDGTTIVQVTHSETNAAYGNRIVRLKDGWLERG